MLKSETRTVINLLREGPPSIITVKRAIMILIKLDAQIDRLYKGLNETAKEQYINGRNDGIREFAEKLNERKSFVMETEYDAYVVNLKDVDELVKELTEEQNEP